jgi:hypothetical protein
MKKIALLLIFAFLIPGCAGFSKKMHRWDDSVVNWFARTGKRMNQLDEKVGKIIDL